MKKIAQIIVLLGTCSFLVFAPSMSQASAPTVETVDISDAKAPVASSMASTSCVSTTFCMAVGYSSEYSPDNELGLKKTAIQKWNGTDWKLIESQNQETDFDNSLASVSCTTTTFCMAVGQYRNGPGVFSMAQKWTGTAWELVTLEQAGSGLNMLSSVSCYGLNLCIAVGQYSSGGNKRPLMQSWDGSVWTTLTDTISYVDNDYFLNSVSCTMVELARLGEPKPTPSNAHCKAVGVNHQSQQTMIHNWDGAEWSVDTSPNVESGEVTPNQLESVSCTSPFFCFAVGSYLNANGTQQTLTLKWDGTNWSIVQSPNRGSGLAEKSPVVLCATAASCASPNSLLSVSCVSGIHCTAVGYSAVGGVSTLILEWDGSAWTISTSPNPTGIQHNALSSVSCFAVGGCAAVGESVLDTHTQVLTLHYSTEWTITDNEIKTVTGYNTMDMVSCVSASFCLAVGFFQHSLLGLPLTQKWDGTSWTVVDSPNAVNSDWDSLKSLSCVTATFCVAVGAYNDIFTESTAQKWDGTSWTKMTLAPVLDINSEPLQSQMASVSCVTIDFCSAVGLFYVGNLSQNLVQTWNGETWTIEETLNVTGNDDTMIVNSLEAVSCATKLMCMAVGNFGDGTSRGALIQKWDGTNWELVSGWDDFVPVSLSHVSCVSTFCSAGGKATDIARSLGAVVPEASAGDNARMQWNGSTWSLVAHPTSDRYMNTHSMSCIANDFCIAVGDTSGSSESQVMVQQWDGSSWAFLSSPSNSTYNQSLSGVSCTSKELCMAVGTIARQPDGNLAARISVPAPVDEEEAVDTGSTTTSPATTSTSTPAAKATTTSRSKKPKTTSGTLPATGNSSTLLLLGCALFIFGASLRYRRIGKP